jgi:ATP-dependent Clp protease protease subunit
MRKRARQENEEDQGLTELLSILGSGKKSRRDDPENFFFAPPSNVFARDNHIYFRCPVSDESISDLVGLIEDKNNDYEKLSRNKMLESATPAPLYLHITSPGGSVFAGNRAIDCIKNSKVPIHTVAEGHVASMGASLLVCGKKRYMTRNSYVLIHQISSGAKGTYHELCDDHENNKQIMQDVVNHYVEHTFMDEKEVRKEFKHDRWWDYTRCKRNGLIDELYTQ